MAVRLDVGFILPTNCDELEEPTPKSRRFHQVSGGCQRWSSADLEHMNPQGLLENHVDFSIRSLKPYSLGELADLPKGQLASGIPSKMN